MPEAEKTVSLTEFTDLEPDELHLVKRGANGFSPMLEKQVLDAVEEAEKEAGSHATDTPSPEADEQQEEMTESEAAKGGAFCGDDECEVCKDLLEKGKLTTADRKKLPKSAFAIPEKAPGPGSYPIHDKAHQDNALSRSSGKKVASRVRAAVRRKQGAVKSPGVPDFATHVDLSMEGGHIADTGKSGLRERMVTGTKPPAKYDTPGGETQGVGGSATAVIPIEDRVLHPPSATLARKTAYSYGRLAQLLDRVAAAQEAGLTKEMPWLEQPNGPAADDPGSSLWESYDSVNLTQVAQTLAACGKAIDAIQQREAMEAIKNPADAADAFALGDASSALDCALGIVARLAFVEGAEKSEEDLEKAGFSFSPMTTATLLAARDHLSALLDARNHHAGQSGATEADEIMTTLTKEELDAKIADGAVKAVEAALPDAIKSSFKKERKRIAQAVTEAVQKMTSNNKGEVSEADIRGISQSRGDADDITRIPDAGQVLSQYKKAEADEAALEKRARKLQKKLKKMKKQQKLAKGTGNDAQYAEISAAVKETKELVQRIARRPRFGGPRLDGQLPPGVQSPEVETAPKGPVTKGADDGLDAELAKAQKAFDEAEKMKGPEGAQRLSDASIILSRLQLRKAHRDNDFDVVGVAASRR